MKKSTGKQVKTTQVKENEFGASVLQALKNKEVEGWIALYPTNDEYGQILQAGLAAKAEGLTQQIIDDILVRRKKEAAAVYGQQFSHWLALGDSAGIDWNNVVFDKFVFTEVYPEPVKLKYLDATIWFTSKQQHFIIDGVQAVHIPSGYKLQALADIRKATAE
ncbi:MAG: hypothetical protein ABIU63_15245 [Chitinophagaceae bacterium]